MKKLIKDPEEALKEKTKKISTLEGCAYSASDGFGVRYVTPFALAIGATNTHIGFLSSVPSLLGSFSQLYAIKLMNKFSRKTIAFFGALFQAWMWLILIGVGALFFVYKIYTPYLPILLIFLYTLLVIGGSIYGPAWNSWMKEIVTKNSGRYFGMRSTICGAVALASMLIAGVILDHSKTNLFLGFMILFGVAFVSRNISAFLFRKTYEPKLVLDKQYYFSLKDFIKNIYKNNFGRFVIYISLRSLTTTIASPFFAVYMLKGLNFNYIPYTLVIMSSSLFSLLFMPLWGKFADVYGNMKVIKICGFLIPLIPLFWVLSPLVISLNGNFIIPYLIIIESFSGFAWAGFNLSASTFIFDAVTEQRMALCVTYYSIINNAGVFIGATLGGFISSLNFTFLSLTPLLSIFLLSSILRLLISLIMVPKIAEVRKVKKFGFKEAEYKFLKSAPFHIFKNVSIRRIHPSD